MYDGGKPVIGWCSVSGDKPGNKENIEVILVMVCLLTRKRLVFFCD